MTDALVAQGELLVALLRARLRPTGQLVATVTDVEGEGAPNPDAPDGQAVVVDRATRAVDRASRRGLFRPTCLVRSLALARLLERWGVRGARIRIGVRRGGTARVGSMTLATPDGGNVPAGGAPRPGSGASPGRGPVRAHAWVELEGRVVGDDPRHVATFTPLGSVTSVPLRWR